VSSSIGQGILLSDILLCIMYASIGVPHEEEIVRLNCIKLAG
jgi:hypothetical protein